MLGLAYALRVPKLRTACDLECQNILLLFCMLPRAALKLLTTCHVRAPKLDPFYNFDLSIPINFKEKCGAFLAFLHTFNPPAPIHVNGQYKVLVS